MGEDNSSMSGMALAVFIAAGGGISGGEFNPAVFLIEGIMSFALMFAVIAGTADKRANRSGGLVIGLTVTMCILAAGPLTGTSMNPARTFGPAICGNHWDMHWLYWLAPITEARVAAIIWRVFWRR